MNTFLNLPETTPQAVLTSRVKDMNTTDSHAATTNRVLILGNEGMMGAGLEYLLSGDQTLDVFGIEAQRECALLEKIQQIKPDIIILVLESQVISPCRLLEALPDYGRIRIILVSAESNTFDVYERQPITAQNQDSLLSCLLPG